MSAVARVTVLDVMRPRARFVPIALAATVGATLGGVAVARAGLPIWGGTIIFLGALAAPLSLKFRDDLLRWGMAACVLSMLLALQTFHTVEHVVQVVQFYLFDQPGIRAQGLISSLNVEWVHFVWNWMVWAATVWLFFRGMNSVWAYPLLLWVTLHTLEHTYMLLHYLHVSAELSALNLPQFQSAQVLPGILGKDGWLANNLLFCRNIPGIGTLPRVAIHFYWNMGEVILLFLTAKTSLPQLIQKSNHQTHKNFKKQAEQTGAA